MILEKIKKVKDHIEHNEMISRNRHISDRNAQLIEKYHDLKELTYDFVKEYSLLSENNMRTDAIAWIEYYKLLKQNQRKDAIAQRDDYGTIKSNLIRIHDKQLDTWQSKVNEDYLGLITLGAVLDSIFKQDEFRMIESMYNHHYARIPKSSMEIKKYDEDLSGYKLSINDYELEDDIKTFLEELAKGDALYTDLTPTIEQWLIKNKLHHKIKLNID